jgi:Na+:H+ antiporter, NhaA family
MPIKLIQRFLNLESSSGIILFVAAIFAMIWANSPLAYLHQRFIEALLFWINEGLMAIFFLVVGLELKRGFLSGQLSRLSQIALPAAAALGGMLVPALIYALINAGNAATFKAWATPVATDIAFALGVLSLFGKRVPVALKLFLLALAIFDDIGAIIIIGLFYSHGFSYLFLFQALVLVAILYFMNRLSIRALVPYLFIGAWLWLVLLRGGLHPTIAGVVLALMVPDDARDVHSPLQRLERVLHPYVAYGIMPLFALANAGFSLQGLSWKIFQSPVVLGIMLGLFAGKQIGIFSFSWLLIKCKWAKLPEKSSWLALYGIALLCGIGFTMSLFLGTLSFQNEENYLTELRLGVIAGSILSALMGMLVLLFAFNKRRSSRA